MGDMITVTGEKEIFRKLEELGSKLEKEIMNKSLREGAKIIRIQAQNNAMSMVGGTFAGKLRRAIVIRRGKTRGRRLPSENIIIDKKYNNDFVHYPHGSKSDIKSRKTTGRRSYIPAAIEYGHKLVFMGHRTGKRVPPIPFMRKAWHGKKRQAMDKAMRTLRDSIDRFFK